MNTTMLELKLDDYVVPPQGGYTAKMLPCRVHNDQVLSADLAAPDSEAALRRMAAGVEFENEIGDRVKAALKAVEVDETTTLAKVKAALIPACDRTPESKARRELLTIRCMEQGVPFIWNARLPADLEGSRVSEPDYLVRIGDKGASRNGWAYAPGDVKHHKELSGDAAEQKWMISTLAAPAFEKASATAIGDGSPQHVDSMQLAHYHRHLEYLGYAQQTEQVWGGIIGKGGNILWRDLAKARRKPTTANPNPKSALDEYDEAFAHRLEVIRHARAMSTDPTLDPIVRFEWQAECANCPWRTVCKDDLILADHITLLQGVTPARAQKHYTVGVETRQDMARLDHRTAYLIDRGVNVEKLMRSAAAVDGATSIDDLLNVQQAAASRAVDVKTAADALKLDAITARYSGLEPFQLANTIDQARVTLAQEVHLRRGIRNLDIPRADIELDVDMENDKLIYLWGTRLTLRKKGISLPGPAYRPFATFVADDRDGECEAFRGLWKWITTLQNLAENTGSTFKAYCYTDAEDRCMKSLAKRYAGQPGIPTLAEVESFLKSEHWVDLHKVLTEQTLWPTENMTLKSTAKWARFSWRESGANGEQSVVWYEAATQGDDEARQKVLDYNEDDVCATYHLREWLSSLTKKGASSDRIANVQVLDKRFSRRRKTR